MEGGLQLRWGKKKGVAQNGSVQFYESFTYDGVEYSLYDCVYMWNEPEPYIGKLVKIWKKQDQKSMVKVVWFFRPGDIQYWLGDTKPEPMKNEIFLASGEGKGLFNLNSLELLCGKCNVVCASSDKRNPGATEADMKMADYIFYRSFDVKSCKISDQFPDAIGGIKAEFFFNRRADQNRNVACHEIQSNESTEKSNSLDKEDGNAVKVGKNDSTTSRVVEESRKDKVSLGKRVSFADEKEDGNAVKVGKNDSISSRVVEESRNDAVSYVKRVTFADENMPLRTKAVTVSKRIAYDQVEDTSKEKLVEDSSHNTPEYCHLKKQKYNAALSNSHPGLESSEGCDTKIMQENKIEHKGKVSDTKHSVSIYDKDATTDKQFIEIATRPDDERRKWFNQLPWEERMANAYEKGQLVLLENLNPTYTSFDVEKIVLHCLKEKVDARMMQQSTFSNPHYGQAYVIFRAKDAADLAVSELNRRCLTLGDGRTLLGRKVTPRKPGKPSTLTGHLVFDKNKFQNQREEMKNAVSTSHCSQPNTVEYDMAMEWRFLQVKSEQWWSSLHERQAKESEKLRSQLKMQLKGRSMA